MTEDRTQKDRELVTRHDERINGLIKNVESIQAEFRQLGTKTTTLEANINNFSTELNRLWDELQTSKGRTLTLISIIVAGVALVASVVTPLLMKALGGP